MQENLNRFFVDASRFLFRRGSCELDGRVFSSIAFEKVSVENVDTWRTKRQEMRQGSLGVAL